MCELSFVVKEQCLAVQCCMQMTLCLIPATDYILKWHWFCQIHYHSLFRIFITKRLILINSKQGQTQCASVNIVTENSVVLPRVIIQY